MKEKLIINTNLIRKESEFRTKSCVVEKAIGVPHAEFDELKRHQQRYHETYDFVYRELLCKTHIFHCQQVHHDEIFSDIFCNAALYL